MEEILRRLSSLREPSITNFVHLIDIVLVAYLTYRLLRLIRGTRAWRIVGGIVIFVIALFMSDYLQLRTLHWVLDKAALLAPVALAILLLPELRQTLEGFARIGLWPERLAPAAHQTAAGTVEEIVAAVGEMSTLRIGALVVVERSAQLDEYVANGVRLDSELSAALLVSIFFGSNPLHDGAVVIRGDRLVAAACRLPLSDSTRIEQRAHMRHRAGLGASEQADCVVVIVSEERGTISLALDGVLTRIASPAELRDALNQALRGTKSDRRLRRRSRQSVGASE